MADAKISALPSATTPVGTEVLPLVQSGVTTKITINAATGITRPFTANGVVYASSTTAQATGSALTFDGTDFATTGTATAAKLIPTGTSVTGNGLYLPAANNVGISTNGTNAVYINSSQNVGIGTSSPTALLQLSSAGNPGLVFDGTNQGANLKRIRLVTQIAAGGDFAIQSMNDAGTVKRTNLYIDSSGIVTMSAYGVGTATFSAAGVISSVSDETWKIKDGVPVDTDAMLKKLEPGYWYYNDEKKEAFGIDRQLGFYAQNVNAAIGPEAAPVPEKGKPWGYYDRSVLAVTVMSLQKALATIESLTARIAALEAK
jgi:hypothetical protein